MSNPRCARCRTRRNAHWPGEACHRYEHPAPLWMRILTRALGIPAR